MEFILKSILFMMLILSITMVVIDVRDGFLFGAIAHSIYGILMIIGMRLSP